MSREKTTRSSFSISPFRLFVGLYLAAFAILVLEGHRADALRTLRYSLMFAALAFVTSRVARSIKDVPRPGRHLWAQLAACATAIVLTGLVSFRLGSEDDTYHEVVGSVYSSGCWQFALEVCAVYFVLRCLGLSGADLGIRRWVSGGTIVALLWIVTAFGFLSVDMMDGMPSPGEAAQQIFQNVFRNGFSEEFLFRGVLLSRLRLILTDEWALFVQALLFGIWHYGADVRVAAGNTLVTACFMITVQAVFGYALGYLTLRTRSIAIGSALPCRRGRHEHHMKRSIAAALAVLAIVWFFCPASHPRGLARDFSAFYCAGQAMTAGVDPYRAEPLGTCERLPKEASFYTVPAGVTLPAPLPPYDLAVFGTIAHLPYGLAAALWIVLILASLTATVEAMHRLTRLPRSVLLLVFGPIDGWSAIFLGEIAPLAVASLAVAMLALREGHPRLSAALLGLSLCEPHVGIAPVLAMFACIPRTRPTIALSVLALIAISFVSVGTATTFEYVRHVLPAHAVSEIASTRQLSLTALLHVLGVRDENALMLGSLSYAAMLLIGLVTARRLASRDPDDPLIIAAPAAFVLLGGVFIHSIQMPAAFPAALVAYTRVSGRLRTVLGAAIVTIATPWMSFLAFGIIVPCIAFVTGALALRLLEVRPRVAFAIGFAAACYVYGLQLGLATGGPYPGPLSLPPIAPHDLAEVNWGENIRALGTVDRTIFDFARLPEWLSIATITVGLWFAAHTSEPRVERATVRLRIGASR